MKEILDWLNEHIGLEGTIFFAFIVVIVSITLMYIIKIFKDNFFQDDWGKKAGRLKDDVYKLRRDLAFEERRKYPNKGYIISLKHSLKHARDKRKIHLGTRSKKKNFWLPIIFIVISILLFVYIRNYTDIFKIYLDILN